MILAFTLLLTNVYANPYPDPKLVPKDTTTAYKITHDAGPIATSASALELESVDTLRVQVDWDPGSAQYQLGKLTRERSGTPALVKHARRADHLGSFKAVLRDENGAALYHDAIGTGVTFRELTRALSFRFPFPNQSVTFELHAENATTGVLEKVLESRLDLETARYPSRSNSTSDRTPLQIRVLQKAKETPVVAINIYAEGYTTDRVSKFWQDAARVALVLEENRFPLVDHMEFRAVFQASRLKLGPAERLGLPVPERDSFLGLYYPYWASYGQGSFARWYHVVYPTREEKYRDAIGRVPYDYPIVLVDSEDYWGVGNYKELTAIPSDNGSFSYLLLHELGHFFGLNEEYEGGGPTELAFAPGIQEPWSQNITFLRETGHAALKWNAFVAASTPLPTPRAHWSGGANAQYGAYRGGYADTEPRNASHKPGLSCVMDRYRAFCPVCRHAIEEVVKQDIF